MTFEETIKGLAEKFSIEGFEADDTGRVALSIDGLTVMLAEGGGNVLVATGYVGEPPPEGVEAFAAMLLAANLDLLESRNAAFALNPETGVYVFVERIALDDLDLDAFCDRLGAFANTLESWCEALADFRPAAETAAKANASEEASPISISLKDFVRV